MRIQHTTLLVITLAISTILAGCMGKTRYPTYYELQLPAPPYPPAGPEGRASVAVREFKSPAYLRQGPLVYRSSPEQIGFYDYGPDLDFFAEHVEPLDMIAELRDDNTILAHSMRETHSLCDAAGDVATASLLENWIDESEKRTWFLFECGQHR